MNGYASTTKRSRWESFLRPVRRRRQWIARSAVAATTSALSLVGASGAVSAPTVVTEATLTAPRIDAPLQLQNADDVNARDDVVVVGVGNAQVDWQGGRGVANVFRLAGGNAVHEATIENPDYTVHRNFGDLVAASSGHVAIGSRRADGNGETVHPYSRVGDSWTAESDIHIDGDVRAIRVAGDRLFVAYKESSGDLSWVKVFDRVGSQWQPSADIVNVGNTETEYFDADENLIVSGRQNGSSALPVVWDGDSWEHGTAIVDPAGTRVRALDILGQRVAIAFTQDVVVRDIGVGGGSSLVATTPTAQLFDVEIVTEQKLITSSNSGGNPTVYGVSGGSLTQSFELVSPNPWEPLIGNEVFGRRIESTEGVVVATSDRNSPSGALYGLDPEDGSELWGIQRDGIGAGERTGQFASIEGDLAISYINRFHAIDVYRRSASGWTRIQRIAEPEGFDYLYSTGLSEGVIYALDRRSDGNPSRLVWFEENAAGQFELAGSTGASGKEQLIAVEGDYMVTRDRFGVQIGRRLADGTWSVGGSGNGRSGAISPDGAPRWARALDQGSGSKILIRSPLGPTPDDQDVVIPHLARELYFPRPDVIVATDSLFDSGRGRATVLRRTSGVWSIVADLLGNDPAADGSRDIFGTSVADAGDGLIAIGATEQGAIGGRTGRVDFLDLDAEPSPSVVGSFRADGLAPAAGFGQFMDSDDGRVLIGALGDGGDGSREHGSMTVITVGRDGTPPTITASLAPPANAAGWHNGEVTVTFECQDEDGGSGIASCTDPVTVSTDGAGQEVTGTATDNAGNEATTSVTVSLDTVAPEITASRTPAANAFGWNNAPVTVSFQCDDALSGVASCPEPITLSDEGADQEASGTATDVAGNEAETTLAGVSIDLTAPTVGVPQLSGSPAALGDDVTFTAAAADGLSGIAAGEYFIGADPGEGQGAAATLTGSDLTGTISGLPVGVHTLNVRSQDEAGNWSGVQQTLVVVYDARAGFATGGGWIVPGGGSSDAGDLLPGLDGASKAQFGFQVKYQNGQSTVPGGNLSFRYNVGDLRLKSTEMEWLVVTNSEWAKFQGLAEIDGAEGLYPFRVDARDGANGNPDRFVIRIWAPGDDPDQNGLLYKASGDVEGGNVKINR